MADPTSPVWPATQTRLPASVTSGSIALKVIAPHLPHHRSQVGLDHFGNQRLEGYAVRPTEAGSGFRGVAQQEIHFVRPEIAGIDLDQFLARTGIYALLVHAAPCPFDPAIDDGEGLLDEFAHRMGLPRRQHEVVRLVLLKDAPHAFHIVARVPPVAAGIEVSQAQLLLDSPLDGRDSAGDLAGDEGFPAYGAFVVEQDAVRGMETVGLPVIDRNPVGVE